MADKENSTGVKADYVQQINDFQRKALNFVNNFRNTRDNCSNCEEGRDIPDYKTYAAAIIQASEAGNNSAVKKHIGFMKDMAEINNNFKVDHSVDGITLDRKFNAGTVMNGILTSFRDKGYAHDQRTKTLIILQQATPVNKIEQAISQ